MSLYRAVTVKAVLSNNIVNASVKMSPNINMTPSIAGDVMHRIVKDYNVLDNKPQINSVTLIGNKEFDDLGLKKITNEDIDYIISRP